MFVCRSVRFLQLHSARTPPIVTLGPPFSSVVGRCAAVHAAALCRSAMCCSVLLCNGRHLHCASTAALNGQQGVLTHVTPDNSAGMDQEAMRTGKSMQQEGLKPGLLKRTSADMSVSAIKLELTRLGSNNVGCIEKADLFSRLEMVRVLVAVTTQDIKTMTMPQMQSALYKFGQDTSDSLPRTSMEGLLEGLLETARTDLLQSTKQMVRFHRIRFLLEKTRPQR